MSAGGSEGLRAGVEALADEWEADPLYFDRPYANRLRALLAAQSGPEEVGGGDVKRQSIQVHYDPPVPQIVPVVVPCPRCGHGGRR